MDDNLTNWTQADPEALKPEDKTNAMLCHMLALTGLVTGGTGTLLGPLIMWLVKKDSSPFVDAHGKEAVNFQISMLIYCLVCIPLACFIIGYVGLVVFGLMSLIMPIIAGLAANEGKTYSYPITIRLIK